MHRSHFFKGEHELSLLSDDEDNDVLPRDRHMQTTKTILTMMSKSGFPLELTRRDSLSCCLWKSHPDLINRGDRRWPKNGSHQ